MPAVGNAVEAERQWRPGSSQTLILIAHAVGNAVEAERQWRPAIWRHNTARQTCRRERG